MPIIDLSKPCDACGRQPVGGGGHCLKCNIYFCFTCGLELMFMQKDLPTKCPLCGRKME
jgi:hypothetical protein